MSTAYQIFVLLHLVCVIGGFGGLAYNGLYLALASRRGPEALAAMEVNSQVSGLAELLVYGAFVFGIAAAGSAKHQIFGQAWVIAAIVLYLVAIGVLHGVIRPAQRQWSTTADELTGVRVENERVVPPQVAVLDRLAARVSLGWGALNVIVVVVVYLMVFKPGS